MMIPGFTYPQIADALRRQSAVALIGPRQVGKTTLALQIGEERDAIYLDLEDSNDRSKLANPVTKDTEAIGLYAMVQELNKLNE